MINIGIHGFSFHSLVLYSQGTFSSWYKVLIQVGETNIWQPHLAKIKYREIHFTYHCSAFKLNNNTLFWPNLFLGLAVRQTPAWQRIQVQTKQVHKHAWTAGCVCFCKSLLYIFSLFGFPHFPVICIQSRLIPPSPSGYTCVRAGVNLETQEGPVDFSSCACGLQQPKFSILIGTATVPVCARPFWESATSRRTLSMQGVEGSVPI